MNEVPGISMVITFDEEGLLSLSDADLNELAMRVRTGFRKERDARRCKAEGHTWDDGPGLVCLRCYIHRVPEGVTA